MVARLRIQAGRKAKTSMVILDSQSVKNTNTAKEKGYDGARKLTNIKRHMAVDSQGLPQVLGSTKASETDRNGAITMLTDSKEQLCKVKKLLIDGGYSGEAFAKQIKEVIKGGRSRSSKKE